MSNRLKPEWNPASTRRWFFPVLGLAWLMVAVVGFGPNLSKVANGTLNFPPIVHVHALAMMAFVVVFILQGAIVTRGRVDLHIRLGRFGFQLAVLAWVTMIGVMVAAFMRYDPNRMGFIVRPILLGTVQAISFPLVLAGAWLMRRRADWHRRLISFAVLVLLQGAIDRMAFRPKLGLPMFWESGAWTYLLALPLIAFDLLERRRIHPATLAGLAMLILMHITLSHFWNNPAWSDFAFSIWRFLYRS